MERVASHRSEQRMTEITQGIVQFAETALFKIMAPEHRGLSSGRRLHKGDTAWEKGIWLGKSETNPEHIVGTKKKVHWRRKRSEDWSHRKAQKLHCSSRYKEYPGTWYHTHRIMGNARDIRQLHQSYLQSTETRRTTNQAVQSTAHLRHQQRKLRAKFRDT